jgi:nucleotide-binding universal stress UspA family protein
MYRHILVPTDGSPLSMKAARTAAHLARAVGARITAIHVMAPYMPLVGSDPSAYAVAYSVKEYEKAARSQADKALARVTAAAEAEGVKCAAAAVTHANPWEAIVDAARKRKCDLIVMASHGRRGLAAVLLGSETTKVLTHSKTPVLVCR